MGRQGKTRRASRTVGALALVAVGGISSETKAWEPGTRVSLGAGGGVALGPEVIPHGILEATVTGLLQPLWLMGDIVGPHLSLGTSFDGRAKYAYGEVSGYFGLSAGLGAGYRFAPSGSVLASGPAWHAFVALPIPLKSRDGDFGLPYMEPYYRPQVGFGSGHGTVHEVGLMVRTTIGGRLNLDFSN